MYNNRELVTKIKCYIFEYIQNLDTVLANLEEAGVRIAGANSQFCQAGIKIEGYICDIDGHHLNLSKVLKIFDLPKCIDVTST